jgi:hypothetical protein
MRWRLTRVRECPVQLWLLQPWPPIDPTFPLQYFGRRAIALPPDAILSATWFEAWLFAHQPGSLTMPRPIEHVYPEYCGLVVDGEVMCGPAGPGPRVCTCPSWGNPYWPHRHNCPAVLNDA